MDAESCWTVRLYSIVHSWFSSQSTCSLGPIGLAQGVKFLEDWQKLQNRFAQRLPWSNSPRVRRAQAAAGKKEGGSIFFCDFNMGKYLESLVHHFFRQLWLVLGVKLMEINSNWFSRYGDYVVGWPEIPQTSTIPAFPWTNWSESWKGLFVREVQSARQWQCSKPCLPISIFYWLVHRDLYFMVYYNPYKTG